MNIGVDARVFLNTDNQVSGVGQYANCLLDSLFNIDSNNQYYLFYNSFKQIVLNYPWLNKKNVHLIKTKIPNKLLHLLIILFKRPKLDSFFPVKLDVFFAPNLHFISVSEDIKFVLTVHDLSFEFYKNCYSLKRRLWHRFLNSRLQCKQADIILTPSDNTKSDLKRFYGVDENKIFTVYPGVGLNSREVESNFGSSKFNLPDKYILFLGAIEPRKNILSLVSAYEHGRFFDKGIYLVIAGAAGWKNKNVLHKIKKTQGVLYVGYVSEAEKINIYSKALLFVYPSFYEGFGFPVLEAMSAGVPVITSNRSSLPEITEGAAYLANPFNVADIERGMKKILEDFKLRSLLVEKGKEQCKKFKWNKTAEQFLSVINKYENRN